MKTSELTGAALDWAVAKYADKHVSIEDIHWGNYTPSTDWAQGGAIIEREKISVIEGTNDEWQAGKRPYKFYYGPTPLIAAMRCYVASKLGDNIDIPEELK